MVFSEKKKNVDVWWCFDDFYIFVLEMFLNQKNLKIFVGVKMLWNFLWLYRGVESWFTLKMSNSWPGWQSKLESVWNDRIFTVFLNPPKAAENTLNSWWFQHEILYTLFFAIDRAHSGSCLSSHFHPPNMGIPELNQGTPLSSKVTKALGLRYGSGWSPRLEILGDCFLGIQT